MDWIKTNANRRGVPIIRDNSHIFLQNFASLHKPENILEIGTAVGYSGITLLKSSSQTSKLITIEHDQDKVEEAKINFADAGLLDRVNVILADCSEQISLMVAEGTYDKSFDLIFLDGPKGQYVKMLEALIMLTKSGGYIIADNVLFRGYVKDKSQMPRRFKTIVKRLNELFEVVKTHPDIEEFFLDEQDDGILVMKIR